MRFAVLGMGSFGSNIARTLFESGHEVLAVDKDKNRIESVKEFVSQAVQMDAASKENLEALQVEEMEVVVVSLGPEMEPSILAVLYLHEMGARRIIAKALSEDHGKILDSVGATEVIYPEKDMAIRTAQRLSSPNILECIPLISGLSIQEVAPPNKFIGKSLRDLDVRKRYGVQIIAVKQMIPEKTMVIPPPDFVIKDSDILIVLGEEEDLARFNT